MGCYTPIAIWLKLESRYISKSLTNKLLFKKMSYGLKMAEGSALDQHINVFNHIISDLNRVDVKFKEEDMAPILLNSLPESYDNLVVATPKPGPTRLVSPNQNPRTLVRFFLFTVLLKFSFSKMSQPESPTQPKWQIQTGARFTPTVFIYLIKTFYLRHFISFQNSPLCGSIFKW